MASAGMNPKTLQYIMGHSDIGVTLNTYTHIGFEDAADEMSRITKDGGEKTSKPDIDNVRDFADYRDEAFVRGTFVIETKIMKSDSGLEKCFDLQFRYDEYLPAEDKNVDWSCYQYFTWLFKKHGLIVGNTNGEVIIYITHWKCEVKGIPFSMVYDEDYDWVTFSVDEEHIKDIPVIADEIKKLIIAEAAGK